MAAAPAIVRFVGGDVADAVPATLSMYEITLAEHPAYQIPAARLPRHPGGHRRDAGGERALLPVVNTGIAGREAGAGQVGAGLVTAADLGIRRRGKGIGAAGAPVQRRC